MDSHGPCEVESCEQQDISPHNNYLGLPPHLLSTIQEQSLGAVMYRSMAVATSAFLFLYAWNVVWSKDFILIASMQEDISIVISSTEIWNSYP